MDVFQAAKRFHYGWVTVIAFGLLAGGLLQLMLQAGPGAGHGGLPMALIGVVIGIVVYGMILGCWLIIAWIIAKSWRGRTWVALTPALLFCVVQIAYTIANPPSPQRYFRRYFQTEMPADAYEIDVTKPTLGGDPTDFVFRCSKQSTTKLIRTLRLEAKERQMGILSPLGLMWMVTHGEDARYFFKVNHKGSGIFLATDPAMQRILVSDQPFVAEWEKDLQ